MSFPLERTLIVGASVSAAPVEQNPVKRLLRKYGVLPAAITHARNGATAVATLQDFEWRRLTNVSCVISVDLFFWDSIFSHLPTALKSMERFFIELERLQLPVIIGSIPQLSPFQSGASMLNQALHRHVCDSKHVHLFELNRLLEKAFGEGLVMDGRRYRLHELIPDGLHPSAIGAEYLSRALGARIAEIINPAAAEFESTNSDRSEKIADERAE